MTKEAIWHCESCGKPIYAGDKYFPTNDPVFCEEHAYTLEDCVQNLQDCMEDKDWEPEIGTRSEVALEIQRMKSEIAATGNRKVLHTA